MGLLLKLVVIVSAGLFTYLFRKVDWACTLGMILTAVTIVWFVLQIVIQLRDLGFIEVGRS